MSIKLSARQASGRPSRVTSKSEQSSASSADLAFDKQVTTMQVKQRRAISKPMPAVTSVSQGMNAMRCAKHVDPRTAVRRMIGAGAIALAALGQLTVARAADLTVDDGVVVKFGPDAQLVVRDRLNAGKALILTSQNDDSMGGQTNATPRTAAAGDWRGLRFEKSAAAFGTLTLSELVVRFGGASDGTAAGSALALRGISPTLQYLQVSDSTTGLRLTEAASPAITGSSFLRNATGVEAGDNSAPVINSTQFVQNAVQAILNKTPATVILATGNWWGHASGPRDAIANPQGLGDAVSAGVNYGSYLTNAPLLAASVRLAAPAPFFEQRVVVLELSCVNATEFRVAEGGAFAGVAFQTLTNNRASTSFTVSDGDGLKSISVQFRNSSGTVTTADLVGGVLVDTLAPSVSISNPQAGSQITGAITVEVVATDSGAGVQRVEFYLDNVLQGSDSSAPYAFDWAAQSATEGPHQLRVVAFDAAGRTAEQTRDVTVARAADALRTVSSGLPASSYGNIGATYSGSPYGAFNGGGWGSSGYSGGLTADLGGQFTLSSVAFTPSILTSGGSTAETRTYIVEVAAVATGPWTVVYSQAVASQSGVRQTLTFPAAIGNLIRITVPTSASWISFSDVKVLGYPYPPSNAADTDGPAIGNVLLDGIALVNSATLVRSATLSATVGDRSGIARVELLLDGTLVATASSAGGGIYNAALDLSGVANGAHTLAIRATDSLNNSSTTSYSVTVTHAVPATPQLTSPASGTTIRTAALSVGGTAQPTSTVQLFVNGQAAGAAATAGSDGRFATALTLAAGSNQIQASATDQWGTSALSAALLVTVDITVPTSPSGLTAAAQTLGKVHLSWVRSTDSNVAGYDLYRAAIPFTTIAEAIKINGSPLTGSVYDDLPAQEGTWYYRAVAVNSAGTPSLPTNQVQAVSDGTPPRALAITYTPLGKVDSATGRVGQGRVNLVVTVNEALQSVPYLAIVPQGGTPIVVELTKTSGTTYAGSFLVDANTPSGVANALFSARDVVGNRGTDVGAGATLPIDTDGPALTGIVIAPASPIKNDARPPLQATFTFSKAPKAGTTPQLSYLLSGPVRSSINVTGLSQVNATTYQATFTLPSDAGLAGPETLVFSEQAVDDLDNISTKVTAFNRFQVYQGDLPPLNVPLGFTAKAQPGGKVSLSWQSVTDAAAYQIYRQAPGQTELTALVRAGGATHVDQTTQDGAYKYAVASVRQSNGQESLSGQSASIDVLASATAPGAPQNLALQLTGQGIVASWQPPLASTVASYNLYRATGQSISDISGLLPLKTGIKQAIALDPAPSPTQGAYVVTALDAAGNESPISNSAYLNASLLPVTNLKVTQLGNDLPAITWDAPNGNVAGYLVYVGPDSSRTKLTPTPIVTRSFTDSGYTTGERRYTVASVDANGVEMPRSVLLPGVSAQVASGLPVLRGVMNKLQIQLANTSGTALDGVRAVVRLPIDKASTQFLDHKSEVITLQANETRLVPVIVGGYADLPGTALAQVGVEIAPIEGELVKIARDATFGVGDGGIVVGMATEDFTRGGTGRVRLTIENTSEVDVELLTAINGGISASTELRFKIIDGDGNVLSTQAYQQALGANVVTLVNGLTVARIPAGESYISDYFSVSVPGSSPNGVRLRLEVDKLRYHTGQDDQVVITGRGSEKLMSLVDTAYFGEVNNVNPISSFGDQDVVIVGRAVDRRTSLALPNSRLKLILNQQGFERSLSVLTDATGQFTYTFKPTLTDSGLYKVSAVHPDITDRPEQKAFTINRVTVGPTPYKLDIPRNYAFSIPLTARAGAGTSATNLRLSLDAASQPTGQLPAGVNVSLSMPVSLVERQTLNIPVVFTANNDALSSGTLILNVISDEHPLTPLGQVTVSYTLSEAKPYLTSSPSFVETGLAQGGSELESVVVENKGLQDALNLRFALTKPDGTPAPSWVNLASSPNGTLAVGGKRSVDLSFTPPSDLAEGVYEFRLTVLGDNMPLQSLNVYASVTQSGQGNVFFKASDIYTATVDKTGSLIPGLANASITVQNEDVLTITRDLVTDSFGEAMFQNLPAGRYKFRARAANHQDITGRVIVKPGITLNQSVFLDYNLITVEWSVREITIQDRYEITLNATYETDVPAAVVVMQPSSVNLPKMNAGDVFYGELSLMNFGLVRADNLVQHLPPSDPYFRYEFLVDLPPRLEAKQRITIPYRVVALQSLDVAASSGTASGGGCYNYSTTMRASCTFQCANGSQSSCGASTSWFSVSNSSCPVGGGGGTGGGGSSGGVSVGGGGSGFGGVSTSTPIKLKGKKCVFIPKGEMKCE